ncbi:MAG: hypothetical protein ACP5G4_04545 [bacterium]
MRSLTAHCHKAMQAIGLAIRDCGLTRKRLHDVTGVDLGAISKVLKGRHYTAQFKTIVDLLWAAGYEIKLERIDPYQDPFYSERRYPPPPLPPREEKKG